MALVRSVPISSSRKTGYQESCWGFKLTRYSIEQMIDKLKPLGFDLNFARWSSWLTVPIPCVRGIAFLAVEVGMHPGGIA